MYVTNSKFSRGRGSHNINLLTPMGRRSVDIRLVKIVYLCIHCLGKLKSHNSGVQCEQNNYHYGYIHRDEAAELTQEERYMKIGKMFPSDYLRGLDIDKPFVVTIKSVTAEKARDQDGKVVDEFVMRFEELDKKLRLNLTMAKACSLVLGDEEADTDNWIGKRVTIYQDKVKSFGKEHIVPRIREVRRDDVDLAKAIKQAKNGSKPTNGKGKAPTNAQELMALVNSQVEGSYQDEPALFEAIVSVLGDNWTWPKPENTEGWRAAFKAAKEAAEKKAEDDEFDLEGQEALAEGSYSADM